MTISKDVIGVKLCEIREQLNVLRNQAGQFLQLKCLDRKVLSEKYKSLGIQGDVVYNLMSNFEKIEGIESFFKMNGSVREEFNGFRVEYHLLQLQYNSKYFADFYNINEQENVEVINNLSDKIEEFEKKSAEIDKIMSNIYGFFGLIVGILTLIFVNFQLITTATSLSLGKMIIYMGLANVGLITGIIVILDVLSILLGKRERLGIIRLITGRKKLIIGLVSLILILGIGTYYAIDRPENYQIIKRLEVLEENKNYDTRINDVKSDQDKILEKFDKLQEENEKLKLEIENLKNKK